MISFESDYIEGAHPEILKQLILTNYEQEPGYGYDRFTLSAKDKILKACDCPDGEVYFLTGGTQTNQILLDTLLKPYEGVISVTSGHIAVHEAGAIEFTGHKVLTLPEHDGKMDPRELDEYIKLFYNDSTHEHMVFPGLVFVTYPTELGTLYSKAELAELCDVAHSHHLKVYLDGARLGYGLASEQADMTLAELAHMVDAFYIGGTKVGALCGEAVVFPNKETVPEHFSTRIKQHGALNAKGRLLGVQFDTLFTDDLYFSISKKAIELSQYMVEGFKQRGYEPYIVSPTNQQFFLFTNEEAAQLSQFVRFSFWERVDDQHTAYRFVTDWATKKENIDYLFDHLPQR